MKKLDGHWIAKRVGIIDHYKKMTASEITLFDVYCLLSNKQTSCCYRTLDQLREILGWGRERIVRAKKGLLKIGFVEERGKTGVYIPKLIKYDNSSKTELFDEKDDGNSSKTELFDDSKKEAIVRLSNSNSSKTELNSSIIEPIIEDAYLIDEKIKDLSKFDIFWNAYPRKRNKGQAKKAWKKIKPDKTLLLTMLEKLAEAGKTEQWQNDGGQFIPYPSTWLNAEGWEDDLSSGTQEKTIQEKWKELKKENER